MKNKKWIIYVIVGIVAILLLTTFFSGLALTMRIVSRLMDVFFDALIVSVILIAVVILAVYLYKAYKKNKKEKLRERIVKNYGVNTKEFTKVCKMSDADPEKFTSIFNYVKGKDNCVFYAKFEEDFNILIEARNMTTNEVVSDFTIKDYSEFFEKFLPAK